jgi:hypothetical protein
MATFSDADKQAAVDELVKSSVRRLYGSLGNRQTNLTWSDMQDATAGLFVSRPKAPYALLSIGVGKARASETALRTTLADAMNSTLALLRKVPPPQKLNELNTASIALGNLQDAAGRRSGSFDIASTPALQQFNQSTDRFLAVDGLAIKDDGQQVPTPQEARVGLGKQVSDVLKGTATLATNLGYLKDAGADLSALNLPATLSGSIVANAKGTITDEYNRLLELGSDEQLKTISQTILKVLAAKAVVNGFVNMQKPGTFAYAAGTMTPFTDALHSSTPAALQTSGGPFVIYDATVPPDYTTPNSMLQLTVDGTALAPVSLAESFVGNLANLAADPYAIPANGPYTFDVSVEGYATTATLSLDDTTVEAESLASLLNGAFSTAGIPAIAEPYVLYMKYYGLVAFSYGSMLIQSVLLPIGSSWATYGVVVGDYLVFRDSTGASFRMKVNYVGGRTLNLDGGTLTGVSYLVEVGSSVGMRIRYTDSFAAQSIQQETRMTVSGTMLPFVGFTDGARTNSVAVPADSVVQFVNRSTNVALAGSAKVSASRVFIPLQSLQMYTDPYDIGVLDVYTPPGGSLTAFPPYAQGKVIRIESGVNAGDYVLTREDVPGTNPYRAFLTRPLASNFGPGNVKLLLDVVYGEYAVVFTTTSSAMSGSVVASSTDTAKASDVLFAGGTSTTARTKSPWMSVSSTVGFDVGDVVELYKTNVTTPFHVAPIDRLEATAVHITDAQDSTYGTYPAYQGAPLPAIRIRKRQSKAYDTLSSSLSDWLALQPSLSTEESRSSSLLGPINATSNPTPVSVYDLLHYLQALDARLAQLEPVLDAYVVDEVAEVTTLQRAYTEKGAVNALNALYYGRYTTFFGMDQQSATTAGALQKSMQAVAQNDLLVNKYGRTTKGQKLVATKQDQNEDTDFSDAGDNS